MPEQSLRIESYSRAHAESLHTLLLTDYIAAPAEEVPSEIIPHEPTLS